MFNPKYQLVITDQSFPQDDFICLGTQLISIVNFIKTFLPEHTWYGANVDAIGKGATKYHLHDFQLSMIGTDLQFIEYCSEIDQFIWGVFVCIDNKFLS